MRIVLFVYSLNLLLKTFPCASSLLFHLVAFTVIRFPKLSYFFFLFRSICCVCSQTTSRQNNLSNQSQTNWNQSQSKLKSISKQTQINLKANSNQSQNKLKSISKQTQINLKQTQINLKANSNQSENNLKAN